MPVKECELDGKSGYKWGDEGKCYTYTPNNEGSKSNAKKSAILQGVAIGDYKMSGDRVSFDFHDTLTTDKGKALLAKEMSLNNEIYIISAARHISELLPFASKYGINKNRVYATGSNTNKVEKLKELNIVKHYDNSQQVQDIADKTEGLETKIIKV